MLFDKKKPQKYKVSFLRSEVKVNFYDLSGYITFKSLKRLYLSFCLQNQKSQQSTCVK